MTSIVVRRLVGSVALAAAFLALVPASAAAADPEPDQLVVDGQPDDGLTSGRFWSWSEPDDLIGMEDTPARPGVRNGISITAQGAGFPDTDGSWSIRVQAPEGEVLLPGTYAGDDFDPYGPDAYVGLHGMSRACQGSGTVTIHEIAWNDANEPVSVALSLVQQCTGATGQTFAQVRINASTDLDTAGTVPDPAALPFGSGQVGVASAPLRTTLRNAGDEPLAIGTPSIIGTSAASFAITAQTCTGSSIPPGSSCSIDVAMSPAVRGSLDALLSVPTNAISGQEKIRLTGRGREPTVTTIEIDPGPLFATGDPWALTATVTPNPGGGLLRLCRTPVGGCQSTTLDPVTGAFVLTGTLSPQTYTYHAEFQGTADYMPSASESVTFRVGHATTVTSWSSWNPSATDRLVLVAARVDPVRTDVGTPTGTITISNADTGTILREAAVSQSTGWTWVCTRVTAGTTHFRAAFTSEGPFLPSSDVLEQDAIANAQASSLPPVGLPSWLGLGPMPCTDLRLAGGASLTTSASVTADADFVNLGWNPAEQIAFSNDGSTWVGGSAARVRSWSLVDPAAGGSNADGTKTVWVRWLAASSWSTPVSATILLDRTPPTVTAPARKVPSGGSLVGSAMPVTISWSGSDAHSGIAEYRLERRTDGGSWASVATDGRATSWTGTLALNHTYQYRVTAVDAAGHRTTSSGSSFRLTSFSDQGSSLRWSTGWRGASSSKFLGGSSRYATTAGARVTFTTSRKGFAWLAAVGPTRGAAKVYVDGVYQKTISLYSSQYAYRRLAFAVTWPTARTRTVVIKVVGTSGHPRIDVDGVVTWD